MFDHLRPSSDSSGGHDWTADTHTLWFYRWVLGVVVAAGAVVYGVSCIVSRSGTMIGELGSLQLRGLNAVALGVAVVSAGLLLHCHFFWGSIRDCAWTTVGKLIGLCGFIAGTSVLLVRVGVWGLR
jgi:hypothetical protein